MERCLPKIKTKKLRRMPMIMLIGNLEWLKAAVKVGSFVLPWET
jgi:hypothetical protein